MVVDAGSQEQASWTALRDVVGDEVKHRVPPRNPTPHEVTVQPGTRLAEIVGDQELNGASWHHQAVDRVAPGWV